MKEASVDSERWEKKAGSWGPQDPRGNSVGSALVSSPPTCPRPGAKDSSNPGTAADTDAPSPQNTLTKGCFL